MITTLKNGLSVVSLIFKPIFHVSRLAHAALFVFAALGLGASRGEAVAISYTLTQASHVSLVVTDSAGKVY